MNDEMLLVSPVELKVVNRGPDTFFVNFKFVGSDGRPNGQPLPDHIANQLDDWQKTARKEHVHIPTSLTFTYWAGEQTYSQTLMIREHGSSPWSWLLYSDDIKINMSYGTLKGNVFCQARFSSHLLHMIGPEQSIVAAEAMLHEFIGEMFHQQASEVHLCIDLQGFDFSTLCIHDPDRFPFVSRVTNISDRPLPPTNEEQEGGLSERDYAKLQEQIEQDKHALEQELLLQPALRTTHRRIATLDFGSHASDISAQIYNKTLEIKKHQKQWFEPIWISNGWNRRSEIWRLEFRFKRAFFNKYDLNEAFSVIAMFEALWKYATEEWLRFVDLEQSSDSNTSRLPTHPVWELVQQAYSVQQDTCTADPIGEQENRLQQVIQEKPLQVIKQAEYIRLDDELQQVFFWSDEDLLQLVRSDECPATWSRCLLSVAFLSYIIELPDKLRMAEVSKQYAGLEESLRDVSVEVLRDLARSALAGLSPDQRAELVNHLSPRSFEEVRTTLVKRDRRMAKLDSLIALLAGAFRSAVALAPPDEIGEISSISGQRVRQPDLYSDALWVLRKIQDYDKKKERVYCEEVWKKRLAYGFVTALQLEEERKYYGVDLAPSDWSEINTVFDELRSPRKQQQKNNSIGSGYDVTDIA
ncbi:hypothetical protein [Dictyobacter formicarum]|uniref:ApeA N-terminal domain-containing protein n=1 Tax=Dictyobacter formicarum TaxID=2778368 RepID=A0ABQ3VDL7_9CHLR|nr:hypothetical protein [Dictyobacter formicarum]GHO83251.1 hypothetical protein KSZ_12570 [Dictyobacter formicarum]